MNSFIVVVIVETTNIFICTTRKEMKTCVNLVTTTNGTKRGGLWVEDCLFVKVTHISIVLRFKGLSNLCI